MRGKYFKTIYGEKIPLPVFFPDATKAVVKTIDSTDLKNTLTPGILVNTYHLYKDLGLSVIREFGGIREFMSWNGAVISDSGGFQVLTLAKSGKNRGKIDDKGVTFKPIGSKMIKLTPEDSIRFQMELKTDMVVVLDDFTPPGVPKREAQESVRRTILWAERSKTEFKRICELKNLKNNETPYLLGVVQGGEYEDLRIECTKELVDIGFDGLGYGGWPMTDEGKFNYKVAEIIAEYSPKDYLLYGLGVGKPQEIAGCVTMGYSIFDCVLPTRDARHRRLYVFNADSKDAIDITSDKFYSYYVPDKEKHYHDKSPVSTSCDCLLCKNYSRAYLAHLFRIEEVTALRLSTIHNLRFYSILMKCLWDRYGEKKLKTKDHI